MLKCKKAICVIYRKPFQYLITINQHISRTIRVLLQFIIYILPTKTDEETGKLVY